MERGLEQPNIDDVRTLRFYFLATMAVRGILAAFAQHHPAIKSFSDFLPSALIISCSLVWFSRENAPETIGIGRWYAWMSGILFLLPLVFPIYLIKSRGIKHGLLLLAKMIIVVTIGLILSVATQTITAISNI